MKATFEMLKALIECTVIRKKIKRLLNFSYYTV
jgi:hypothetical protein